MILNETPGGFISAMKADRKRLKGEKLDLLNQMKQLYTTLEDKESELRDFIRNYEQRVGESDETIKLVSVTFKIYIFGSHWKIFESGRQVLYL